MTQAKGAPPKSRRAVRGILDHLHTWFPPALAENWDNVGLQVGDPDARVGRIAISLNANLTAVREASGRGGAVLVTHHPLLFSELKRIDAGTPTGRIVTEAIRKNVHIISCHTNADWAPGGVNDALAEALDLRAVEPLEVLYPKRFHKIVVFVPPDYLEAVSEAIFAAGGGIIGDYAKCSYRLEGHGTFLPQEGADPFSGTIDTLALEAETRLEVRVPENRLDAVLAAMMTAHPYEEVAFDVYPTERQSPQGGRARVGRLPRPTPLAKLAAQAAGKLKAVHPRFVGDADRTIDSVVVCGGGGISFGRRCKDD